MVLYPSFRCHSLHGGCSTSLRRVRNAAFNAMPLAPFTTMFAPWMRSNSTHLLLRPVSRAASSVVLCSLIWVLTSAPRLGRSSTEPRLSKMNTPNDAVQLVLYRVSPCICHVALSSTSLLHLAALVSHLRIS